MKRLIFIISLLILSAGAIFAQTTENQNWTRIESDTKDFSIVVPPVYQVIHDDKGFEMSLGYNFKQVKLTDIIYITAFEGGASFLVESYKTKDLRAALTALSKNKVLSPGATEVEFEEFQGTTFFKTGENSYQIEIIIGKKDRVYRLLGGARDKNNETLKYFFSSLQLNGKQFFSLKSTLDSKMNETSAQISKLKETPFKFESEEKKNKQPIDDTAPFFSDIKPLETDAPPIETKLPENKKGIVILQKQVPRYTDAARQSGIRGKVRLRVTFSGNGTIEKIVVVDGLKGGLTESAVQVARLIRFLPQEIDNIPVTVTKTVEYSFSIY